MNDAASGKGKYVSESQTEQVHMIMPRHLNGYGSLFGGQLAMWIDTLASVVATRHCRGKTTTAAMDNLRFREPAGPGDVVVMRGRMAYVGVTSMEVRVDSYVENVATGDLKLINTAFVIMIALDENGKPRPVPPLLPQTPEELRDYSSGEKRREMRKKKNVLYE